jgi:hypothetical protein
LKNLRMFKKLCGAQGLSCVVLATTMWSQVTPEEGERRESELISNQGLWGEMIQQGSTVMRQDRAEVSAIQIIQYILNKPHRMVLDIQEEMASGKTIDETSVGRELEAELQRMRKKYEAEMKEMREDMLEAQRLNDKRSQEEITAIRANLQKKMDQDREDRERMRVTIKELQKQRDAELREERQKNSERELAFHKNVAENAQRLKTMEFDSKHNLETTKLEYERQKIEIENARLRAIERKWEYKDKSILPTFGGVVKSILTFPAKVTRPTESMETATPMAFQTLEEFLDSIPGIQAQKRRGGSESRDQLRTAVEKAVALQLKIFDPGDESWLTELVGQNHSGEDNAQFIATLLVEYALNRPWVLHNGLIKGMIASTPSGLNSSGPASENIIPRFLHSETCTYHMLYRDPNRFLIDCMDNVSRSLSIVNVSKKRKDLTSLPEREVEDVTMTTNIDTLLGMAGFVPILPTAIPFTLTDSLFLDDIQDKALCEFQSHIHF